MIIRDNSSGSNASTVLCEDAGKYFYRKYASGYDGEKLYQQAQWMERFKNMIPLAEIIRCKKEENFCYYDMPYDSSTVSLFEYIHSVSRECAWECIQKVTDCLEHSIYQVHKRNADKDSIDRYISLKVETNIEKIMTAQYFRRLMQYEEIVINGICVKNLPYYLKFLERKRLREIFSADVYAEIHGDLTIENIICRPGWNGGEYQFYLIDPNTGNIHDSPNLDYGKLLQSMHGGYECLMTAENIQADRNNINFTYVKSEAYHDLYIVFDQFLSRRFSEECVRSIYYHEMIHWLRLMPYKMEKDEKRALLFYTGMLLVMNDVVKRFERGGQMKRKLALFDLDGTLFDTGRVNFYSYNHALHSFGLKMEWDFLQAYSGRHYKEFLPLIMGTDEHVEEVHRLKQLFYRRYIKEAVVNRHLFEMISCMEHEYYLAVVTSASRINCEQLLEYFGKREQFQRLFAQEDVCRQKPDPEGFLKAMSYFGISGKDTVIFEDSDAGIRAGERSGATVFVVRGFA